MINSEAAQPIRVLVCDDEALIRTGFATIIDAQPDLQVVGECGDGRKAVDLARRLRPDVVVMDIRMPMLDGIRTVAAGTALLAPEVTRALVGRFASRIRPDDSVPTDLRLTERELEVLRLIADGRSNSEIAASLRDRSKLLSTPTATVWSLEHLGDTGPWRLLGQQRPRWHILPTEVVKMATRNVVLSQHQHELVESLVESGRYQNASEVLREGLRLLEQREAEAAAKLTALHAAVEHGWSDLAAGRFDDVADEDLDDFIGQLGSRAAKTRPGRRG